MIYFIDEKVTNFNYASVEKQTQEYKDELAAKISEWKDKIEKWGVDMIEELYKAISGLKPPG